MIPPLRRTPLLLAAPGRAAGMPRARARTVLAGLAVLALLAAIVLSGATVPPVDPSLAQALVDGVRHGGWFYEVAADACHQAGVPCNAFRVPLPSLAVVTGALPHSGAIALLWLFAAAVVVAWWGRLAGSVRDGAGRAIGAGLVAIGAAGAAWPTLVAVPEAWAGLLVALSLARWRPAAPVEATGFGLAAAVVAPGALAYIGVMAAGAVIERRAREAAIWMLASGVVAIVLAGHGHVLAALADAPDGVLAPGDYDLDLAQFAAPAFEGGALPSILAAALFGPALAGWAAWREPVASRALVLIVVAALLALTGAHGSLAATGLLAAPLLPLGLLAVPDLIGDLAASARDKRRITVTRPAR